MNTAPRWLALACALTLTRLPLHGLTVNGYASSAHDRFASGFPASPVASVSASFVGAGFDWSGVGWDAALNNRNIALISSEYFVYATHYPPSANLRFLSPVLNTVVSYTWNPATSAIRLPHPVTGLGSDFSVGRLSSALNPAHGLATYPILGLPSLASYVGLPLLTYGFGGTGGSLGPRVGLDTIAGFADADLYPSDGMVDSRLVYHLNEGLPGQTTYQTGDSSGPLFVPWNGSLALVGSHSAVAMLNGVPASSDNFIPAYFDAMESRGITYVVVPEPAWAASLCVLGLAVWGVVRRRASPRSEGGTSC